jgi:deazaflavin-dependent oxidoreductase (nitroreductase family)
MVLRNQGQISDRIRSFNKHILNPFVLKSAGTSRSPFAVVRHIGRRSGKAYETPILLAPVADGFSIELTYGPDVDWYRNVLAAGHCTILWHGQEYTSEKPEPIDTETGLQTFPLAARLILRLLARRHFVKLKCQIATA